MIFWRNFQQGCLYNPRKIDTAVGSIQLTIFLVVDVVIKQIVLPVASKLTHKVKLVCVHYTIADYFKL